MEAEPKKNSKNSLASDIIFSCKRKCPVCTRGRALTNVMNIVDKCSNCGEKLGEYNIGDGAVVFLLFVLCFSIIPFVLVIEFLFAPALWVHALLSFMAGMSMMFVLLPIVKSYILLLEYRHRSQNKTDI